MVDPPLLAAAALVIFVAAFVQGVTGFAHALIAIGLLVRIFGVGEAVLILSLLAPVICVVVFVRVRKAVVWREVFALALPCVLVGMPLGIWAFSLLLDQKETLTRMVGVLLVVSAGYFLTPLAPRPRDLPWPVGAVAGLVGGFLGGLTSTGGPPLVLYLYAREMEKVTRMAVLQGVFLLASTAKVAMLAPTGLLSTSTWLHAAALTPPLVLGVWLGQLLFDRIPAAPLRKIALTLLLVIGAWLIAA